MNVRKYREQIAARVDSGENIDALALELNATPEFLRTFVEKYRRPQKIRKSRGRPPDIKQKTRKSRGRPPDIKTHTAICDLFDGGKTVKEISKELRLTHGRIHQVLNRHRPDRPREPRGRPPTHPAQRVDKRAEDMKRHYTQGYTLRDIGTMYGISRERVRQILQEYGINRKKGGAFVLSQRRQQSRELKEDALSLKRWGCTREQYLYLLRHPDKPTYVYTRTRRNWRRKSDVVNITLWQWWQSWQDSGHWADRGRGKNKFHMTRKDNRSGYTIDNITIMSTEEHVAHYWQERRK